MGQVFAQKPGIATKHRVGVHLGHSHAFFWDQKVMTGPNFSAISAFDLDYTFKNKFYYGLGVRVHNVATPFVINDFEEFKQRSYSQIQSRFGFNLISNNSTFRLIPFAEVLWRYGRDYIQYREPGTGDSRLFGGRLSDRYNAPGVGFGILTQASVERFDFTLSLAQEYFAKNYEGYYYYEIAHWNWGYRRTYPINKQQFTISLTLGYHFDF